MRWLFDVHSSTCLSHYTGKYLIFGRSMVSKNHKTITAEEITAKKSETQSKPMTFHCVHKSGH
jgi:hypothetical protein